VPSGVLHTRTIIESFNIDKRFYREGPVIFKFVLKNKGNVRGRLSGRIIVINTIRKKRVGTVSIPGISIMPNARKEISFKYPLERPFGKYKAELLLTEKLDNRKSRASTWFYGLPWAVLGMISLIGALTGLLLILKRKFKIVRKTPDIK